ncbi:MAG: acetaldehyde dehydrogenase (acetylating) [Acidobacteriia bacterium]|nr:acetaldehyde dehydrogenase (acetylating) [Terriglobia bacterium]
MSSTPQAAESKDARSVAEARELVDRAYAAYQQFQNFTQEQVDRIIDAMADAATANAEKLARMAVEETGYGVVADKVQKNLFSSQRVYEAVRAMKTVGVIREDKAQGIIEVAAPVGVVAAILPSTNPTSTAIYKILIALKGRNAIVLSPHPTAFKCTCETTNIMRDAALQAGAPADVICCFTTPTLAGTQELMKHKRTSVILSTGGMSIVRAAYSSGKPAYGVGPGNVPAFIDRSADVAKAVADVVFGKTFDNGTICSSEQAIVAEEAMREQILAELKKSGAHFLKHDEIDRLSKQMVNLETHTINPKFVGKSARKVAELAGFQVPEGTRVLVAELNGVGREYPLSAEKLSPVLALYFARDRATAFELCYSLLRFGGLGHTCAIHAKDDQVIREYGLRMPAGRIVVNSPAPQGSIGSSTNLFPAMTLGCGAPGGNITSDNISPLHLINLRRVAYEARPVTRAPAAVVTALAPSMAECACKPEPAMAAPAHVPAEDLGATERVAVARAIERFLARKGAEQPAPAPAPSAPAAEKPAPAAVRLKPRPVDFVSEAEVRDAMKRKEKILVGKKTIITPAARDLAAQHDIFVKAD